MKILKFILFLFLLVIIGGSIYFGAKEGSYDIKNKKIVNAPYGVVYDIVNDYESWKEWHPNIRRDTTLQFTFSDKTVGKDASFSWNGDFSGTRKTLNITDSTLFQTEMFNTPYGIREQNITWDFKSTDNNTVEVTISRAGEHSFLDKVYFNLFDTDFNESYEDLHSEALNELETFVLAEMNKFEISESHITEYGGGFYIYITSNATNDNISSVMAKNYGTLISFVSQNKISLSGMPFTIYYEMSPSGAVMANALPVNEKVVIENDSNILSGYIPKTKVVKTTLKGNYIYLSNAWQKAETYVSQYQLEKSDINPFEIYSNDPGDYPNPANWTTDLYIPIK